VLWIGAVFAGVHSALALRPLKRAVLRVAGPRRRYGLYRCLYVAQSALMCGWAIRRLAGLPDRELYRVPRPWSWLMLAGQAASLGLLLGMLRALGFWRSNGLAQLVCYLRGGNPAPEPEAQGPQLAAPGAMARRGPYGFTRHPGDLAAIGVALLPPRMTVNRAALAVLVVVYSVAGAYHEEYRLRAAYGEAYARYRAEVPFLLPRPRHWASKTAP
jgi:hypothetical protein